MRERASAICLKLGLGLIIGGVLTWIAGALCYG